MPLEKSQQEEPRCSGCVARHVGIFPSSTSRSPNREPTFCAIRIAGHMTDRFGVDARFWFVQCVPRTQGYGHGVEETALLFNVVATWTMVGVIWFVQVVHYPLLAIVPVESASVTAGEHQRRTGFVVGPPMAVEGVTTLFLLWSRPDAVSLWLPWTAAVLLAVALGCTVLLSVPRHERMARQPDAAVGRELVITNWPRTIAWSLRGILTGVMMVQVLA